MSSSLENKLLVHLANGESVDVSDVRRGSLVKVGNIELHVDLIVMRLTEFDIILGMDWLFQHKILVDCYTKEVVVESLGKLKVVFVGENRVVPMHVTLAMEARRLISDSCDAYLAHIICTREVSPGLEDIKVMREFPDVSLDDL